jgi:hypothetical protein
MGGRRALVRVLPECSAAKVWSRLGNTCRVSAKCIVELASWIAKIIFSPFRLVFNIGVSLLTCVFAGE